MKQTHANDGVEMFGTQTLARRLGLWSATTAGVGLGLGALRAELRVWPALLARTDLGTRFDDTLTHLAALALALCLVWFWTVTTIVVVTATRRPRAVALCPEALRRLLLAGCGVAALGALTVPAHAHPLDGLPLPERTSTVTPAHSAPDLAIADRTPVNRDAADRSTTPTERQVRVRAGDSLWRITRSHLTPDATDAAVATSVHALHRANRDVVGADPDLIHPGQVLRLPGAREEHP